MKLIVFLAFKNEEKYLTKLFESFVLNLQNLDEKYFVAGINHAPNSIQEIHFYGVDAKSEDQSLKLFNDFFESQSFIKIQKRFLNKGILISFKLKALESPQAFSLCLKKSLENKIFHDHDFVWVLSADLNLEKNCFYHLWIELNKSILSKQTSKKNESIKTYVFEKIYSENLFKHKILSIFLNQMLNIFHLFVWTNAPCIQVPKLKKVLEQSQGFLDDLDLCVKERKQIQIIKGSQSCIQVSPRNYTQTGFLIRCLINFRVLWGYFVLKEKTEKLLAIYKRQKKK